MAIISTTQSKAFAKELAELLGQIKQPLKLIIHAGTPKTGTTSLQVYLDKKQRKLKKSGTLYPNRSHNPDAPKHHILPRESTDIALICSGFFQAVSLNTSESSSRHARILILIKFIKIIW